MIGSSPTEGASADRGLNLVEYVRDVSGVLSWRLLVLVLTSLLVPVAEGFGLALLAPLLQGVGLDVGEGSMRRVTEGVARAFDSLGLPLDLGPLLAAFVGAMGVQAIVSRAHALYAYRLQQDFVAHLRARLYRALLQAEWRFFIRNRSSDFMHKLVRELEDVGGATFNLIDWFAGALLTLVYVGFALYLSPAMTGIALATGAVLSAGLWSRTRLARERGGALSDAYGNLFGTLSEHLQGMKTAKSHGVEARHADLFLAMTRSVERAQVSLFDNQQTTASWFRLGSMVGLAATIFVAVEALGLAPATVAVLLYVFSRLIPRLSRLQSGYQGFLSYVPAYLRVRDLEARCTAAAEPTARAPAPRLRRELVFDDVSFAFASPPAPVVLEGVRIALRAGTTTAVVGPSGAGKSTLADLVVGLLRPTRGRLLVDGAPLRDDQIASWRGRIGYVAQETFLFHDTARANLLLTRPDATERQLDEALERASAGFLRHLPDGLDTVLGDRGVRLSGGERQRLALARALLREPDLLVLDEATSALDAENEERIQEALDGLQGKATILLIAHRLAAVRRADAICVIDGGRVVEQGTWTTLLAIPGGRFRALAELQGLVPGAEVAR